MEMSTGHGRHCQTGAQSCLPRYSESLVGLHWAMLTSGGHELVLSLDLRQSPIPSTGFQTSPGRDPAGCFHAAQVGRPPSSRLLWHLEWSVPESASCRAALRILSKRDYPQGQSSWWFFEPSSGSPSPGESSSRPFHPAQCVELYSFLKCGCISL